MEHPIIITNKNTIGRKPTMRRNLEYQGIARRAINILPQGAEPTYDRGIDISAVVIK